jgi:hypothetical protein
MNGHKEDISGSPEDPFDWILLGLVLLMCSMIAAAIVTGGGTAP